jgi:predicted MFS family arabinose efflux permease
MWEHFLGTVPILLIFFGAAVAMGFYYTSRYSERKGLTKLHLLLFLHLHALSLILGSSTGIVFGHYWLALGMALGYACLVFVYYLIGITLTRIIPHSKRDGPEGQS